MKIAITNKSALIIVDVQKDFLPKGSLPIPRGDEVIEPLNKYIDIFLRHEQPIYATRDWHPENHISFKKYGGIWPSHCIQNTRGAEFADKLHLPSETVIINKGYMQDRDAYSGFQETYLDLELRRRNIKRVFIGGLATEYCVEATVLDALKLGYETILLLDAIRSVDANPGDSEKAIKKMFFNGAIGITLDDIFRGILYVEDG